MASYNLTNISFLMSFHGALVKDWKEKYTDPLNYFLVVISDVIIAASTLLALYFVAVSTNWSVGIPNPLFQVIGLLPLAYSSGILFNLAEAFISERADHTLELILVSPCSRAGFVLGKAIASVVYDTVRTLIAMTATTIVLLLIGVLQELPVLNMNLASLIVSIGLSILSLYGIGLILSAFGLARSEFPYVHSIMNTSIFFLSGYLYPVKALPTPIRDILYLFPFANAMESIRDSAVIGATIDKLLPRLAVMAFYIVFIPLGIIIFRHIEHNAKLVGKLYEM